MAWTTEQKHRASQRVTIAWDMDKTMLTAIVELCDDEGWPTPSQAEETEIYMMAHKAYSEGGVWQVPECK